MQKWEPISIDGPVNSARFAGIIALLLIGFSGLTGWGSTSANASPPAVDQYVEQLPSPGGERPAGAGGGPPQGSPEGGYSPSLEATGDDGSRAAAILGSLDAGSSSKSGPERTGTTADDSSIGDVIGVSALGGSGTDLLLPLSMLAIFILGLVLRPLGRPVEPGGPSAGD